MKNCWITPEGKIIYVPRYGHNEYANELLKKELGLEGVCKIDKYPYQILHERGWIRVEIHDYEPKVEILGYCIDLTQPMRNTIDPPMNPIQMRIAKMICEECGVTLHQAINDRRFW